MVTFFWENIFGKLGIKDIFGGSQPLSFVFSHVKTSQKNINFMRIKVMKLLPVLVRFEFIKDHECSGLYM